jgi:hypothetical protein
MKLQHLHKRRGYWYYIRRVPDRARPVDPRKWINKTTGVRIADDPRGISASARAAQLETSLLTEWEDCLAGRNPAPAIAFARNVDMAKRHGRAEIRATSALGQQRTLRTAAAERLAVIH